MSRLGCSLAEAAEVLGVGRATVYDHLVEAGVELNKGKDLLRVVRIGERIIVPVAELERVLGHPVELPERVRRRAS